MAVTVSLTVSPAAPAHGSTVTATYAVSGNASGPGTPVTLTGEATVGGQSFPVTASFTIPSTAAAAMTFAVPTCPGLTFKASAASPAVFTAVVP
ncbi:MAG TPA: hypothetical protein VK599_15150 [Streptosporangiaceae bacterium]|nr:hypothetical protein [Streptosporangiaceae bacterium]